jgi:hypothetical protein
MIHSKWQMFSTLSYPRLFEAKFIIPFLFFFFLDGDDDGILYLQNRAGFCSTKGTFFIYGKVIKKFAEFT